MSRWYVDASIALHAVLPFGDDRAVEWLDAVGGEFYSSTLLQLEVIRALRREQIDSSAARQVLDRVNLVSIGDGILSAAGAIVPHITSLDSIHLATCTQLGAGLTVATHDTNMAEVAKQLGLEVFDPLMP